VTKPGLPVWLFVSYGGGHVKALLPVVERVRELGIAQPLYLALTTAAEPVRRAGITTLGFRDVLAPGDDRALRKGEELVAQLQVRAADRDESIAYLGLSYTEMEDRLGAKAAAEQYAHFGRQAFLPLGILRRIVESRQPSLVVATNSPRAEQAAIHVAREKGVPSACLVDLLGIWERELLARPDYADVLCVLNEGVRQSLIRAGRPAGHIHATGNPAFDTVNEPSMIASGAKLRRGNAGSPVPATLGMLAGSGDEA
jgi:hypothetical protein